jgi:hypothetical protein
MQRKPALLQLRDEFRSADAVMVLGGARLPRHDAPWKLEPRATGQAAADFQENGVLASTARTHNQNHAAWRKAGKATVVK